MVRLVNKFILAVGKMFTHFIDFCESREVRVHHRFEKMLLLVTTHFSNYMKNGGMDYEKEKISVKETIAIDFKDSDRFLSKEKVFVGSAVREFLKQTSFTPNSSELADFYVKVFDFYTAASEFMIKYFKTGLLSKTLQYLSALSPTHKHSNLETLEKMWLYLAEKFPSVISLHELDDLKQTKEYNSNQGKSKKYF